MKTAKQALLFKETGELIRVDFDKGGDLQRYYDLLECDTIDIVEAYGLKGQVDIIVDDEGLFKENPQGNLHASLAYGYLEHGQPIVGNALLVKRISTPDGIEEGGFTKAEADSIINEIADQVIKIMMKGGV